MRKAYYNDNEPYVVQWLKNLIEAGLLPQGDVDDRPVQDLRPADLRGYSQCHFFAGIGGWPLALQLAGWPADRPVWTGSCPCQPFSVAGQRRGTSDERHLWPFWASLIKECKPATVLGEQVASKDGRGWLSGVFADLENVGYAVAGADLCAAGSGARAEGWVRREGRDFIERQDLVVGSPHIRQRLWWVALSSGAERREGAQGRQDECDWPDPGRQEAPSGHAVHREDGGVALANGRHAGDRDVQRGGQQRQLPQDGEPGGLADTQPQLDRCRNTGPGGWSEPSNGSHPGYIHDGGSGLASWADAEWLPCLDGKARRVPQAQSGIFPLVDGVPARVAKLRAIGNAIVPQTAAAFVQAVMDCAS